MLPNIAVNSGAIVNTKDMMGESVPTGIVTTNGPYHIVQRVARRSGAGCLL